MADRFQKWTDRAQRAFEFAEAQAHELRHNYVGTEHMLLGLVHEEEGLAAKALVNMGVELDAVRSAVAYIVKPGDEATEGELQATPRMKKAIELSINEARQMNHHYIGTEHLLLGLIRQDDGIAAGVLGRLGVNLDEARCEVLRLLAEGLSGGSAGVAGMVPQWLQRGRGVKRYNLAIPEELFDQVQALADRDQTTVLEVLRRFIKLGLLATEVQQRRDAALIIREGEKEREILLL